MQSNFRKGRADRLKLGSYNAICDRCGTKFKAEDLTRDWQGLMLCRWDWEPRQPQDFVRGQADPTMIPWSRSQGSPEFVLFCTPDGRTAVAGMLTPGCATPSFIDPANTRGL